MPIMGPLVRNFEPRARLTFWGRGISKRYANGNGNVNKGPDCGNIVLFLFPSLMSRVINVDLYNVLNLVMLKIKHSKFKLILLH